MKVLHNVLLLCSCDHSAISYIAENSATFRCIWLQLAMLRRSTELQQVVFIRCSECMQNAVMQKNVLQTLRSVSGVTWYINLLWTINGWGIFSQRRMRKGSDFVWVNMVTCKAANCSSSSGKDSALVLFIRENLFAGWLIDLRLGWRPYGPNAPRP
jgi:hypothetical protein